MIVAITGDHPRHTYLVGRLAASGLLSGWVREVREAFVPEPPAGLPDRTADLFRLHFRRREEAEARHFGGAAAEAETLEVARADLNAEATVRWIVARRPRLVLSYGCHKLGRTMRETVGGTFWNTHGGLSPDYRGVTTHFWPSFLLEPQMTGVTLHETTDALDGGAVIHQAGAPLVRGDGLHDLAARTVKAYADTLPGLLATALDGELPAGRPQTGTGKLWHSTDWRPEHLHPVYETWEDRVVDAALDGRIAGRAPALVSVLS